MRVDSEELLSRSLCAASVILLLVSAVLGQWIACFAYAVMALLSFLSDRYYRAKVIREKFQIFLVLFRTEASSKDIGHAGADR
jgi:hypothetical protein